MSKPLLIYSAPVATVSGYGAHSRDILRSLYDLDRFDIKIVSQRWGSTPMNALSAADDFHVWMLNNMVEFDGKNLKIPRKPDVWIQVSVPNEFQRLGTYNIGITAGMETTAVHQEWITGANNMDLIIVPSEHSKYSLLNSVYKVDDNGNESTLKLEKDIEVLFEGFDESIYTNSIHKTDDLLLTDEMSVVKEDFAFLFVGHWLKGDAGHDRKDVSTLIKTFCDAFKNAHNKPALILKTSSSTFSVLDREAIAEKINKVKPDNAPPIYLMHGELTDKEMNNLYNHPKVKAMVSFTKGEGFGRPLLEFTQTGKPVIASNWSGHLDFLTQHESVLINGELKNVHKSAVWEKVIIPESSWFYVNQDAAKNALKDVYKNYKKYHKASKKLMNKNKKKFTLNKMTDELQNILDIHLPEFPKQIELKLPKLEKL
jgi:glycosyltransferase involved in cell wall biosynthesis